MGPAGARLAVVDDRTYRITVERELGAHLGFVFAGMALANEDGAAVLTGHIRDQPELQGLLRRISDLALTLLMATSAENDTKHLTDTSCMAGNSRVKLGC